MPRRQRAASFFRCECFPALTSPNRRRQPLRVTQRSSICPPAAHRKLSERSLVRPLGSGLEIHPTPNVPNTCVRSLWSKCCSRARHINPLACFYLARLSYADRGPGLLAQEGHLSQTKDNTGQSRGHWIGKAAITETSTLALLMALTLKPRRRQLKTLRKEMLKARPKGPLKRLRKVLSNFRPWR